MTNVRFTPAQAGRPAIAAVPEKEAEVEVTMSLRDAHIVRALLGKTSGLAGMQVYQDLHDVLTEHDRSGRISFMGTLTPTIHIGDAVPHPDN